jgi:ribosome-binding factor A
MITITDVEVSSDHAHATVFFTLLGDEERIKATANALKHAAGYLRTQLARRIRLRVAPQLQFKYDASVERGARLSRLIDDAISSSTGGAGKK